MSAFIPELWSTAIFQQYRNKNVFAPVMNRSYEGTIRSSGDTVKINEIGPVTVNSYTSADISYEALDDASKVLKIDTEQYAGVHIGSVDKIQANVDLVAGATREIGIALAQAVDTTIASKYSEYGILATGTTSSATSITSANILTYLSIMNKKFDENNNPMEGRVAILPPWMIQKLTLAGITKDTLNQNVLGTGYYGNAMGWDILMSNQISHSGTTWYAPMFFLKNNTIAHAEQLVEIETLKDKARFGDYLRALLVYGTKVIRPSSLGIMYVTEGAES